MAPKEGSRDERARDLEKLRPDEGSALQRMRRGVFPEEWSLIPTAGKGTFVKQWTDKRFRHVETEGLVTTHSRYDGLGVVTGELSGGLVALDIDGPEADARYATAAGEGYEERGGETTMAWTSGKPGRRQLLYRVPEHMVPQLRHVHVVVLKKDGAWALEKGDEDRTKEGVPKDYEEVVLRFNRCQSVLPGSIHPEGRQYKFLQYNDGKPADAPEWILDVLRGFAKPQQWLSEADLKTLEDEVGTTLIHPKQIRGWFFSDTVQRALQPRLADLIFKHPTFDEYGWTSREGTKPQMVSGCPWHGGTSGTSFQYSTETGCWDCKACGVGGDVLDFVHKIEVGDKHAGRPKGPTLEHIVARLAGELGFTYPDDAKGVQQVETVSKPQVVMVASAFFQALDKIQTDNPNPAEAKDYMAELAQLTGRRMSGTDCIKALQEYKAYRDAQKSNDRDWHDTPPMSYIVPGLLPKPAQVILHAAPGLGKTSAAMGFARMVLRGEPMTIRGIQVPIPQGKVLWIQNDQNPAKLRRDCEDNGIDLLKDADKFIVKKGFQLNYITDLTKWINEVEPALVVIDSIGSCSTDMQEQEKDKAFASPLYHYGRMNGEKSDLGGFPPCAIVWIHHDNAQGQVRGTRYLTAAVDEVWRLRAVTDAERDGLRGDGRVVSNCRLLEIGKSRLGREGHLLVVEKDIDGVYSVWDRTPTEVRQDGGTGDPEPATVALRVLRDRARGTETLEARRMTAVEVWEEVVEVFTGLGREAPSRRSIERWVRRWKEDGVLVSGGYLLLGKHKNKRTATYAVPILDSSTTTRAGWMKSCRLSSNAPETSESPDFVSDTEEEEGGVSLVDLGPITSDTPPEADTPVACESAVAAVDLVPPASNDTNSVVTYGTEFDEEVALPPLPPEAGFCAPEGEGDPESEWDAGFG
jgi:hypothetical protein